jgi:hypothetical protein
LTSRKCGDKYLCGNQFDDQKVHRMTRKNRSCVVKKSGVRLAGLIVCLSLFLFGEASSAVAANAPQSGEPSMGFVIMRYSVPACEPTCPQWIAADGKIERGTATKFSRFLGNPNYRKLPLILNSNGGSIEDALAMGRLIRRYSMNTGIGRAVFLSGCSPFAPGNKCKPDPVTKAFLGADFEYGAHCYSACPLILLGGTVRVVDPSAQVGLHQPTAENHPYMDRYWETWRIINGRKQIISRKFVKRVYLPVKTVTGITPGLRKQLSAYVRDMGASPRILDEMQKASPRDMNLIPFGDGSREKLGLTTSNTAPLSTLTGENVCKTEPFPANCVFIKEKRPLILRPFERGNV